MVTMAESAANWRNANTVSYGSHAFTHTLAINTHSYKTTLCEAPPAQLLRFNASWVLSCFRYPPNCDMDYGIFIVRTYVMILVRAYYIYTRGVGHTDSESAQHFSIIIIMKNFSRRNSHSHHGSRDTVNHNF